MEERRERERVFIRMREKIVSDFNGEDDDNKRGGERGREPFSLQRPPLQIVILTSFFFLLSIFVYRLF